RGGWGGAGRGGRYQGRGRARPRRAPPSAPSDRSEVEVGVGGRRRNARQRLGQDRPKRGARLHPRVPGLRRLVFVPWHVAQIVGRRDVRGGGEIGRAPAADGRPIGLEPTPTEVRAMVW